MGKTVKGIGRWQGAGMMATTLLGTSIFILPQLTVANAGFNALYAWLLLTLAIIPVALIFGKLAGRYPHAAGPAYFVEKAYGHVPGRVIGLLFMLAVPVGAPAAIVMTIMFFEVMVPLPGIALLLSQLGCLLLLLLINIRGIQVSAKLQFALTLVITLLVVLMFGQGMNNGQPLTLSPIEPPLLLGAAGIAFWSFLGVEAMSHLSDDFDNPRQDMIPAMLIGTVMVGLIYLGCTLLVLWYPNNESISMVGIFEQIFSANGRYLIGLLGIAGGLATINVYTASLARLVCSFAQQQLLPGYLAKQNQYQVPINALVTVILLFTLVLLLSYFTEQVLEDLINWVNGVFVVIYAATMLAAWRLLGHKNRPIILLGIGFCIALAIGIGSHMIYSLILILLVMPIVIMQKRHHQVKASKGR